MESTKIQQLVSETYVKDICGFCAGCSPLLISKQAQEDVKECPLTSYIQSFTSHLRTYAMVGTISQTYTDIVFFTQLPGIFLAELANAFCVRPLRWSHVYDEYKLDGNGLEIQSQSLHRNMTPSGAVKKIPKWKSCIQRHSGWKATCCNTRPCQPNIYPAFELKSHNVLSRWNYTATNYVPPSSGVRMTRTCNAWSIYVTRSMPENRTESNASRAT